MAHLSTVEPAGARPGCTGCGLSHGQWQTVVSWGTGRRRLVGREGVTGPQRLNVGDASDPDQPDGTDARAQR